MMLLTTPTMHAQTSEQKTDRALMSSLPISLKQSIHSVSRTIRVAATNRVHLLVIAPSPRLLGSSLPRLDRAFSSFGYQLRRVSSAHCSPPLLLLQNDRPHLHIGRWRLSNGSRLIIELANPIRQVIIQDEVG